MRAFAQLIDESSSATSEIMNGKRRVSSAKAKSIVDRLGLSPVERSDMLKEFSETYERNSPVLDKDAKKLSEEDLDIISDPIHFAILSLIRTANFIPQIDIIAERLGRDIADVRRSLIWLQQRKLISFNSDGSITRISNPVFTSDDVSSKRIREMHLSDMKLAAQKIQSVPVALRDFTNLTIPCNPELLPRAKEILRRTHAELHELLKEDATEVYRICMYLFPLTEVKHDEN